MRRDIDDRLSIALRQYEIEAERRDERTKVTKEIAVMLLRGGCIMGIPARLVLDESSPMTAEQLADLIDAP